MIERAPPACKSPNVVTRQRVRDQVDAENRVSSPSSTALTVSETPSTATDPLGCDDSAPNASVDGEAEDARSPDFRPCATPPAPTAIDMAGDDVAAQFVAARASARSRLRRRPARQRAQGRTGKGLVRRLDGEPAGRRSRSHGEAGTPLHATDAPMRDAGGIVCRFGSRSACVAALRRGSGGGSRPISVTIPVNMSPANKGCAVLAVLPADLRSRCQISSKSSPQALAGLQAPGAERRRSRSSPRSPTPGRASPPSTAPARNQ